MKNNMTENYNNVIKQYLESLDIEKIDKTIIISTWWGNETLHCFTLDPWHLPKYFRIKTSGWEALDYTKIEYQYDLRGQKLGRPKAYRVPFLNSKEYHNDEQNNTVSHLCHNSWCLNPRHHVLEDLADNKGRNGCPGGLNCKHAIRCLIPGPQYHGSSSVATTHELVNLLFIV